MTDHHPDSEEAESVNADAWQAYGTHHLRRGTVLPEATRLDWGIRDTGPGAEILGELSGRMGPRPRLRSGPARRAPRARPRRPRGRGRLLAEPVRAGPRPLRLAARPAAGPGRRRRTPAGVRAVRRHLLRQRRAVHRSPSAAARPGRCAQARRDAVLHRAPHQHARRRSLVRPRVPARDPFAHRRRRDDRPDVGARPGALDRPARRARAARRRR